MLYLSINVATPFLCRHFYYPGSFIKFHFIKFLHKYYGELLLNMDFSHNLVQFIIFNMPLYDKFAKNM